MTRQTSEQTPIWCGIHYLLYLRQAGEEEDCARFSLFQTEYSPAGGGHAGFLYVDPGCLPAAPANGVYTDNPDLAEWLYNRMYRGSDNQLAECGERVITARFGRSGDMRRQLTLFDRHGGGPGRGDVGGPRAPLCSPRRSGRYQRLYLLFLCCSQPRQPCGGWGGRSGRDIPAPGLDSSGGTAAEFMSDRR